MATHEHADPGPPRPPTRTCRAARWWQTGPGPGQHRAPAGRVRKFCAGAHSTHPPAAPCWWGGFLAPPMVKKARNLMGRCRAAAKIPRGCPGEGAPRSGAPGVQAVSQESGGTTWPVSHPQYTSSMAVAVWRGLPNRRFLMHQAGNHQEAAVQPNEGGTTCSPARNYQRRHENNLLMFAPRCAHACLGHGSCCCTKNVRRTRSVHQPRASRLWGCWN